MSLLKARLAAEPGCPLVHVDDYKLSMKGKIVCPQCDGDVVAKMGFKNVHHFAHKSKTQCDSWTEPMTAWHKGWQDLFASDYVEVIMTSKGVKHIADVAVDGHILEIQHSKISAADVKAREEFYTEDGRSLTWIVDGHSERDCVILGVTHDKFAAIWANRSWWWHAENPVLIDTDEGLFRVIRFVDKRVGLATRVTNVMEFGVTHGLTVAGNHKLHNMLISTMPSRILDTSYNIRFKSNGYIEIWSDCNISGETYNNKELLKSLGLRWSFQSWAISHNDDFPDCKLSRNSRLWGEIARQTYHQRKEQP